MRPATGVINPSQSPGRMLALALGVAALCACVPTANVSDLPDAATALPCYGTTCVLNPGGAAVTPAPQVHCEAAQQGLEFANQFIVLDNEDPSGIAQYFYQYVDGTAGLFPTGYEPPVIAQTICDTDTSVNHVLHESGGPFTGWGGGLGIGLAHLNSMPDGISNALCSNPVPSVVCPPTGGYSTSTPCYCPSTESPPPPAPPEPPALRSAIATAALDVSQWDGISFWARRGPNGQPLMRVLVGDKFTDDDISYLEYSGDNTPGHSQPRLCERKGECSCLFQDTTCDWYSANDPTYGSLVTADTTSSLPPQLLPMSAANPLGLSDGGGAYYCGPPGSHPPPASTGGPGTNGNYCGRSLCDQPYPAYPTSADPEWVGRACTPYTYRNGTEADLCYNPPGSVDGQGKPVPADPLPAESDEQCGDHFTFPVHLSEDWQFFAIPFAQMSQQGWAKQAPYFDLTSASVVRFTWDAGYVDYYLDNVRFYRVHQADGGVVNTPPP